jgi:hypothetical protein
MSLRAVIPARLEKASMLAAPPNREPVTLGSSSPCDRDGSAAAS